MAFVRTTEAIPQLPASEPRKPSKRRRLPWTVPSSSTMLSRCGRSVCGRLPCGVPPCVPLARPTSSVRSRPSSRSMFGWRGGVRGAPSASPKTVPSWDQLSFFSASACAANAAMISRQHAPSRLAKTITGGAALFASSGTQPSSSSQDTGPVG